MVGAGPAFEIKFLVEEDLARAIETHLSPNMSPDPHSLAGLGPGAESGYRISSLYCDTAEQFVYQQRGRFKRYKLRVRRYGAGDMIFLERKSKQQQRVKKRRTEVACTELSRLHETAVAAAWNAAWFHARALRDGLRPVCRVDYSRVAYFARSTEGPLRLTFDRQIRGMAVQGWNFSPAGPEHALLRGQVICEFKFRGSLPALFKSAIAELALAPRGVSKFRQTMGRLIEAQELPAPPAGED